MTKLVLLRHGESVWNQENRFTGWCDVDLSAKGLLEAKAAGEVLKKEGYVFDEAYTSVLKRAIRILWITLDTLDLMWIPVTRDWRLNERHYGMLQGLDKAETAKKYGPEQIAIWRRSYDTPPPPLDEKNEYYPGKDPRYQSLSKKELPLCESLKDTVARFMPFYEGTILPRLKAGKKVLIAAHGNTIRALVKYLDHMSEAEIAELNIPTGTPLVYELDDTFQALKHYYLGDQEKIKAAVEAVKNQSKVKA